MALGQSGNRQAGPSRSQSLARRRLVTFGLPVLTALITAAASAVTTDAWALPAVPPLQTGEYAGPDTCGRCHQEIHTAWEGTRHANAFSSPIFQQNWVELGSQYSCLSCHTTGYDAAANRYAFQGVTCEACHGPFQEDHPAQHMPITADARLCATCHKVTKDEWDASKHGQVGIQCQSCHNPHSQQPRAVTVTELCTNCHKERGETFTHSTHANAGLECSSCHMYTDPASSPPIQGLVATGHTFAVGSQACVGCHQDTVHTRDTILRLSGEVAAQGEVDPATLQQQVQEQQQTIEDLEAGRSARLYVGLAQGAIIGLATGGVAAWIISRRLRIVEVSEGESADEQSKSEGGDQGPTA
jgi:predicted CXXCH cytochrome family protein